MPDTFDRFTPRDRGRFGDNERAPSRSRGPRVTGTSNIIDLDLVFHHATDSALLVSASGDEAKAAWLPKSQVEYEMKPGVVYNGSRKNGTHWQWPGIKVTLPEWLASAKGLV